VNDLQHWFNVEWQISQWKRHSIKETIKEKKLASVLHEISHSMFNKEASLLRSAPASAVSVYLFIYLHE
jgi:hypothetical protein